MIFSVLNAVLLRPLPYSHPERLVQIWEVISDRGDTRGPVSPYNFLDWQRQSHTLEAMATYQFESFVLTGEKAPERLRAVLVTPDFFRVFKAVPLKGRTFLPNDEKAGDDRMAVLSYGAWRRYFGGDQNIVGKSITLDDQSYSVVGIMRPEFSFPGTYTDVWCLPGFDLKNRGRGSHFLFAVGRMRSGVTFLQAQTEMNTIADRLAKQYSANRFSGVRLVPLHEEMVGNLRARLLVLWAAVLAVLLIACANVAGLLLARAVSRQKEVAIRTALGGSRWRLIRQFLAESVLLAIAGGLLAVLLALAAGKFLRTNTIMPLRGVHIDATVLAFTGLVCLVTGLLFGLAPAVHAVTFELVSALKEGGWRSQIADRWRLRSLLVIAELAVSMVLLVSAGLLTRTLWRLQHVDPGFQPENVLGFRISVPQAKYTEGRRRAELYQRIVERLAAIPGVESVGATNDLPFSGSRTGTSFDIEGRTADPAHPFYADSRNVSPDYLQTMRMRLLSGREFTSSDNRDAPGVAVVNEAFARKFFPSQNPIGQRVKHHDRILEIVGVIGDIKFDSLTKAGSPELYIPYLQDDPPSWTFVAVRSRTDLPSLIRTVRKAVNEVAPDEPIYDVETMNDRLSYALGPQKLSSLLLAIFAGLALVLASVGIYGAISYWATQRTHEMGIRMALGASQREVMQLVIGQTLRLLVIGLVGGMLAAMLTTRALAGFLYGVGSYDPLTFVLIAILLGGVAVCAGYIPARRATMVDPMVVLRDE